MEKISSFERVVGNISEVQKEKILQDMRERFDDQIFESLKGKEREKTPDELQIIFLVNEATNEIRRRYGLDNFDIPSENIHVISETAWPKNKEGFGAFYNSQFQAVTMLEAPASIVFMKRVFHEMIHFKSYNALQVTNEKNPEIDEYRVGLTVNTRDGQVKLFVNLNEAITEEITKRFAVELFGNQIFSQDTEETKNVAAKYPNVSNKLGNPIFNSDTFYAKEVPDGFFVKRFSYELERKILNTLIDKILERNSDKFQDREEVFEVFAKGMMTGNILPVGKLVEKTFGKGTLRKIGELDEDIKGQEEFVNSL